MAMVMEKAAVYPVSEFSPECVEKMFMISFPDIHTALQQAFRVQGNAGVLHAFGGSTLPVMRTL